MSQAERNKEDGRIVGSKEYLDTQLVTDVICGGQRPGAVA